MSETNTTKSDFFAACHKAGVNGCYVPGRSRPFIIEWTGMGADPFTGEDHRTDYPTAAEAIEAARSING